MSTEGQAVQKMLEERRSKSDLLKEAEEGWCDSQGTVDQIRTKLQLRQEGALKRERVIAYSLAQKQWRPPSNVKPKNTSAFSLKNHELDSSNWGWSWLERWMAAKSWENRLMEQAQTDPSNVHNQKNCEVTQEMCPKISDPGSIKIKKNNVTTRVSAKSPAMVYNHNSKMPSVSSSEFRYDESSASSSSVCTSTPVSGTTQMASEKTEESNKSRPNYTSLTESIKAKQKICSNNRNPSLYSSKFSSAVSWKDKSLTRNHGQGELLL